MKVIIVSTVMPFTDGGASLIVTWLEEALKQRGHAVETLLFPFSSDPPHMIGEMLALRMIDLTGHGERLIAIRTPSYLIRHPNKVLWFIHHHRGAYDFWGTPYQDIPNSPEGLARREAIIQADNVAFAEARAVYTNSQVVSDRLRRYNNVSSTVLYPPLGHPEGYHRTGFGDFILYVSRLTHHKRQWLAIEGLRCTQTPVRLVIAGKADPGQESYEQELRSTVDRYGLNDRVEILSTWIGEREKQRLFAECLASIYIPQDEDSYGYASLESHHAGKAVISATDSGGTSELIIDGLNGFLTEPEPAAIGAAMDKLYLDRSLAESMGGAGAQRIHELGITWDGVIDRLLS